MGLFGGDKPSGPKTTKDLEADAKKAKKEKNASSERGRKHRFVIAKYGSGGTIPLPVKDE